MLRGLRPEADLTHLPPGDSWRPGRIDSACSGFVAFDVRLGEHPRSHLQAAMDRLTTPLVVGA